MSDGSFSINFTFRGLVIGDVDEVLVQQHFLSQSPEDTRALAATFRHVSCKSNRIRPNFRIGTQGRGGRFDSSSLGASTFVGGLLDGAEGFSLRFKGRCHQCFGYSASQGIVSVTDNKAGWKYPKLVQYGRLLSRQVLEIEEHGFLGRYKFDAYIPFYLHDDKSSRVIGIHVDKTLAETVGYKRFISESSHMRYDV